MDYDNPTDQFFGGVIATQNLFWKWAPRLFILWVLGFGLIMCWAAWDDAHPGPSTPICEKQVPAFPAHPEWGDMSVPCDQVTG